ncbi:FadR/GntR family transcriptional regulator [Consotaella salsifontis]|uniref:Transcriptional regulator, GntR family n=1 Tax=Consotaella salsifontis TaxID=1365950 RepID=A0A1T4N3N8_9HYPH|nr:FadR/GntR family transcriptional regulator [Consotaella salsifontis]SJZ73468.1 transcriptional regulator, GntR family [Consotaella salsifontis]
MFELPAAGERRYLQIANDLLSRIAAGEFPPGSRLPPERELASSLQVSRATVREALLALELMRAIEIRLGSGVFVLPEAARGAGRAAGLVPAAAGPSEILEMRRLIEGESAYRAAQRGTEAQFEAIGKAVKRMQVAIHDLPRFDRADIEFHLLIAEASGNRLVESYIAHLWNEMRTNPMWDRWYDRTRATQHRHRSAEDHEAIHRALTRRLPEVAASAMQAHVDILAQRFMDLEI